MSQITVIGSGFSGLSAACHSALNGHNVTVLEKNSMLGGRARYFYEQGFTFEMGPSWYWMPDVFEKFFNHFGKSASDYYDLVKLDPGFQIFFGDKDTLQVPASLEELYAVFESIEKGSAQQLKKFLAEAELKYSISMEQLIYKPALSWTEYASYEVISNAAKMHVFKSIRAYIRSFFKDERLIALMEFPSLFLGAMPDRIPALYSLMNYSALSQGTWYPMGGMYKIISAMQQTASSLGVSFLPSCDVQKINVRKNLAVELNTSVGNIASDAVIASADYRHVEKNMLDEEYRNYDEKYWDKRILAPSCLIFFVGVNKKIKNLIHHNLFFDADLEKHSKEIYEAPDWPSNPLFYVCAPSKTDPSVAPGGYENLFILIPVAPGLKDTESIRNSYFDLLIKRIEKLCGDSFSENIIFKKSYCIRDFEKDYNAYKGNAYGLANTLRQTAVLKPSMQNKKIKNLFYTGQLTVPGPGVPPALISGQIASVQAHNLLKNKKYEKVV
ncbi:MAG: phytoene desaturase family protein [Bacteroidia bacterium]